MQGVFKQVFNSEYPVRKNVSQVYHNLLSGAKFAERGGTRTNTVHAKWDFSIRMLF